MIYTVVTVHRGGGVNYCLVWLGGNRAIHWYPADKPPEMWFRNTLVGNNLDTLWQRDIIQGYPVNYKQLKDFLSVRTHSRDAISMGTRSRDAISMGTHSFTAYTLLPLHQKVSTKPKEKKCDHQKKLFIIHMHSRNNLSIHLTNRDNEGLSLN